MSYLHNNRPYLSVSDIDLEMTSSTEHWQAESAHAWAALHPWSENIPPAPKFRALCTNLLEDTDVFIRKIHPDHHRYFILTLIRMIWSMKEINGSPMASLGGVAAQLNDGTKHLQRIVDRFLHMRISLQIVSPLSKKEVADAYREAQMVHISHLHGAGDLMDWLHMLLRDPSSESTRLRMTHWAAQDAMRVREVAYHSSQVLSILRQYQANYPLEPFSVFHAGAALWCVAQVLPRHSPQINNASLRIDKIPTSEKESFAMKEWVASGSHSHISLFGVPNLASDAGREHVLEQTAGLLKRMTCWSMSQSFLKVIMGLMDSGPDR